MWTLSSCNVCKLLKMKFAYENNLVYRVDWGSQGTPGDSSALCHLIGQLVRVEKQMVS